MPVQRRWQGLLNGCLIEAAFWIAEEGAPPERLKRVLAGAGFDARKAGRRPEPLSEPCLLCFACSSRNEDRFDCQGVPRAEDISDFVQANNPEFAKSPGSEALPGPATGCIRGCLGSSACFRDHADAASQAGR